MDEQSTVPLSSLESYESNAYFNNLAAKQLEVCCIRQYYAVHQCFAKDKDSNTIAWYVIENELAKDPTAV